ncbi:MAG: tetraacyldisaccharide 4'-kinase [Bacteroidales bacterium]|nr:tetraacyldisaccharide 4'-kinase [Bacteroidales bacterium]
MLGILSKTVLFPYYMALKVRHFLYDKNIKKSTSWPVPVICVGNITVGGTGKTPHTEMLIRLLGEKYNIAVLSRGYKRESKGFRIARITDSFKEVGDEPLQIKQKFPDLTVAVCKSRREGIEKLLALPEGKKRGLQDGTRPQVIILDDGFQHRKVKPSHSIVLVNYNKPIFGDNLLPIGSLRDLPGQIKRAESVIISKSPVAIYLDGIMDQERTVEAVKQEESMWRKNLALSDAQRLYFSVIKYGEPLPVFHDKADSRYIYSKSAIFFTGIANDLEFRNNLVAKYKVLDSIKFADHKNFSKSDIRHINSWARKNPTAAIFTTEKDSKRLLTSKGLDENVISRLFYIPIEVTIVPQLKEQEFIEGLI